VSSGKSKNHYQNEAQLMGGLATIFLVVALVAAYVVFQVSMFVVLTFIKYHSQRALWIALASAVGASVAGVILYKVSIVPAFLVVIPLSVVGLLITCLTVQLTCSETLMRENASIFSDALNTSWWSDGAPKKGAEYGAEAAA